MNKQTNKQINECERHKTQKATVNGTHHFITED